MKITEERLKWLNDNKAYGEIAKVVKQLNPNDSKKGIDYTTAGSIMAGNLWGKWGAAFTDALEKSINARLKQEAKEKAKYATV